MEWSVLILMISTLGIKEFGIFCIIFLCHLCVHGVNDVCTGYIICIDG